MAAGPRVVVTVLFGVLLLVLPDALVSHMVSGSLDTNEIIDSPMQPDVPEMPRCRAGSACGYLQVNAFGVTSRQFCSCGSGGGGGGGGGGYESRIRGRQGASTCNLHWDPEDGRSITMGSQQFKYCGPPPPLHVCGVDDAAYTAAYLFHKSTFSLVGERHLLHCLCPPPRHHLRSDTLEEEVLQEGELVMATVYTCAQLPVCVEGSPCKEVSIGVGNTGLVHEKCRCPHPLAACPTLTHSPTPHDNTYPRGSAYSVHCLPLF